MGRDLYLFILISKASCQIFCSFLMEIVPICMHHKIFSDRAHRSSLLKYSRKNGQSG